MPPYKISLFELRNNAGQTAGRCEPPPTSLNPTPFPVTIKPMTFSPKILFFTSLIRWSGVTLLIMITWHILLSGQINFQLEQNLQHSLLISEKALDVKGYEKRQQSILSSRERLDFIVGLRQHNDEAIKLLTLLNQARPLSIQLTQLYWQDGMIRMHGYAHSETELTDWLEGIKQTSTLFYPVIHEVNARDPLRYFQLNMRLR